MLVVAYMIFLYNTVSNVSRFKFPIVAFGIWGGFCAVIGIIVYFVRRAGKVS